MTRTGEHTTPPMQDRSRQGNEGPSRLFLIVSWSFVAIMGALIFFMSAKSGYALNTGSGIISLLRNALISASVALFGHPVDVSPIGHFTEFFLLGLALANALRLSLPLMRSCTFAVLIASIYGVTDEVHQLFVPGRTCDPMDWLVDTAAALLAALIFGAILHLKRKRKKIRA